MCVTKLVSPTPSSTSNFAPVLTCTPPSVRKPSPIRKSSVKRSLNDCNFVEDKKPRFLVKEEGFQDNSTVQDFDETKDNFPIVAIKPLLIEEIDLTVKNAIFDGKVLNKYGTFMVQNVSYSKNLKVDLADKSGFSCITLHIDELHYLEFVKLLNVDDCIRISNFSICNRNPRNDGGTSELSLTYDPSTQIEKIESFAVNHIFYPETTISQYKEDCKNLINKGDGSQLPFATLVMTIIQLGSSFKKRDDIIVGDEEMPDDLITVSESGFFGKISRE